MVRRRSLASASCSVALHPPAHGYPSPLAPVPSILTIGTFDGVHLGHAALVHRAREVAADVARSALTHTPPRIIACTFDPHPLTHLRPESAPPRLSTFEQRATWLRHLGCDEVIRLEPTPELLSQSPEAFIDSLLARHALAAIIEGPDFRFGHQRAGDIETLRRLGHQHAFEVHIVEPITTSLTDQSMVTASSSLIRWLIGHGRVGDAAMILGREYEITGTVVRGEARGRTLGFPTANINAPHMLPADGIYAGTAQLPEGHWLPAAISLGTKPTFGRSQRTLEAMLLTAGGDSSANWSPAPIDLTYDWPITLRFTSWLREQLRFARVEELTQQMSRDCGRVMELARTRPHVAEPVA